MWGSVYLWSVDVDFYLLGVSASAKEFKELALNIIYRLRGNRNLKIVLCLNYHYMVVFDCFLSSSSFFFFPCILMKTMRLKLFNKQEVG